MADNYQDLNGLAQTLLLEWIVGYERKALMLFAVLNMNAQLAVVAAVVAVGRNAVVDPEIHHYLQDAFAAEYNVIAAAAGQKVD